MSLPPQYQLQTDPSGRLVVVLSGSWTLRAEIPAANTLLAALASTTKSVNFDSTSLEDWDTRLLIFLKKILDKAEANHITVVRSGLPQGVRDLLSLSEAVPEQATNKSGKRPNPASAVGQWILDTLKQVREVATFIGEVILSFLMLMRGRRPFKTRDFFAFVQDCGVESLPIVSLIATLVGVILSFVGAVQLKMFGAQIYVANLVGLGMAMEMGALMSGVIISGRIGASYAAQLGTMQVNEEIDALRTMGISPVGFLVLPRMLALMLMMPLLCVYADIMGILGGSIIGVTMLDLSMVEYMEQIRKTLHLSQCGQGLLKSAVFGVLIAFAGCLRGMQCGRSASAVGEATTSAVVTSIVLIVISDSFITYLLFR